MVSFYAEIPKTRRHLIGGLGAEKWTLWNITVIRVDFGGLRTFAADVAPESNRPAKEN
jgi:hypothetical protein